MSATQQTQESAIIERNVLSLRERVEAIEVKTPQDYVAVCNMVVEGRGFIKRWQNVFAETIRSAKEHLTTVQNELKSHTVVVEQIVSIAEKKGEAWKAEERKAAQAEQDRINRENQKKRDEEAAAQRLADEAKAKEEREWKVAEIRENLRKRKITKREAEKLLRAAGATEEADKAAAAAREEEAKAAPVPEVKVEPAVPKVAGIKGRVNYKFEVVDASRLPREYMKPDEVKIGEMVRRIKDCKKAEALIPGIRAFEVDSI